MASIQEDGVRVDVVIPLYQKAAAITRAVDSVLGQTTASWRLVVVDDGSTDGWTLARADPRIEIVRQQNRGPGAARNAGAARGTAPVVAFLDADDEWQPTYLVEMLSLLDAHPDALAASSGWSGTRPSPLPDDEGGSWRWASSTGPAELKARIDSMHTSGTLVRREAFERFGGFYEHGCTYGEDSYLWAAIAIVGPVVRTPAALVDFTVDFSTLSIGRTTPYPLPPLLTDSAVLRSNVGAQWPACMPDYLLFYGTFVLVRSIEEGAIRPVARFFAAGGPRRLGLGMRRTQQLLGACLGAALRGRALRARFRQGSRAISWS